MVKAIVWLPTFVNREEGSVVKGEAYQRRGRKFHPIRLSENNKRGRWPCYVFREIICVRCRSKAPDDFVIEKVVKA